jgi:hypothetical protein
VPFLANIKILLQTEFALEVAQSSFIAADAHAHVHRLVSVVRMATVLEESSAQKQRSFVRILWAK